MRERRNAWQGCTDGQHASKAESPAQPHRRKFTANVLRVRTSPLGQWNGFSLSYLFVFHFYANALLFICVRLKLPSTMRLWIYLKSSSGRQEHQQWGPANIKTAKQTAKQTAKHHRVRPTKFLQFWKEKSCWEIKEMFQLIFPFGQIPPHPNSFLRRFNQFSASDVKFCLEFLPTKSKRQSPSS